MHSRHRWLVNQRADVERLLADPDWYDARIAGWWVWGISQWIGSGWCPPEQARGRTKAGQLWQTRPDLGEGDQGVQKYRSIGQLPMLHGDSGASGRGVHSKTLTPPAFISEVGNLYGKIPHLGNERRGR